MTGNFPKRGDVYWVNFDQPIGSEIKKRRPCVIISDDKGNRYHNIVIVAPITSKINKVYPHETPTLINGRAGKIVLRQCRAIDKSRLEKKECELDELTMIDVNRAIRMVFELP